MGNGGIVMNTSLLSTSKTFLVLSMVAFSVGCSKVKFDKPPADEKNTTQATPTPAPESTYSGEEGFEVSSGGIIDAADATGEILLSGTAGAPVETLQVSDTASDDTLSTGFWSLFNVF